MTLKPSEHRAPPPKTASPPDTKVVKVPADLLIVAMPEPSPSTVDSRRSHRSPVTVLSAVTRILLVRGSTAHEVPGMLASDFRVRAPLRSSPMLLSTSRTSAPARFARTTASSSSPGTTLTTSRRAPES